MYRQTPADRENTHTHSVSHQVYDLLLTFGIVCTAILSKGKNAVFAGILHLVFTCLCMCVHADEVLLPKSRGKMTGIRRRGGCSSINQRMEGETEGNLRWEAGVLQVKRGRGVMIGWKRTEEGRSRGVQKGLIQEERNERRVRE